MVLGEASGEGREDELNFLLTSPIAHWSHIPVEAEKPPGGATSYVVFSVLTYLMKHSPKLPTLVAFRGSRYTDQPPKLVISTAGVLNDFACSTVRNSSSGEGFQGM